MKRLLWSFLTAGLITTAILCFTIGTLSSGLPREVGRPDVQETREIRLPAAKLLSLTNENGSVHVYAQGQGDIKVEADIKAYARSAIDDLELRNYVASLLYVSADESGIHLVTEPVERPDTVDLRVDYSVLVPKGTDLGISGANGNVWISKGCGEVTVEGRNADIEVVEPIGSVNVTSTNGRIRVLDAPQGATIRTVNGNVYAHMRGGVLEASTTNGAIVARVLEENVEACTLSSQNGGITIVVDERCGFSAEAKTQRGVVTSDFPAEEGQGVHRRRHLRETVGNGHTRLRMDTLNGNIWIARSNST